MFTLVQLRFAALTAVLLTFSMGNAQVGVAFDGTDDKIDCGNNTSLQITGTAITLEAWVYTTAWKTYAYEGNIINKEDNTNNNGYMLRVGENGKLNFGLGNGTKSWTEKTTGSLMSLNTWYHIAGTYDGNMMRLYIDGVEVDSLSASISIGNASGVNMAIGAHGSTTYSRFYQGIIDEVRVWDVCRSQAELQTAMNSEFCSPVKGLQGYYKFNQGKAGGSNSANKKVFDLSGNGNNGTLQGFALTGNTSNWAKGKTLSKGQSFGNAKVTRCDFYFSPSGKYKWTKSGVYADTTFTAMECDSILSLDVTILKSSTSNLKVTTCGEYTSPSGSYTWKKSGVYKDYLRSANGCDSIITITLTIGGSRDTIAPVVCNSYTSPSGKYVWTKSGKYGDTLKDYLGCDSLLLIDLTVNYTTRITNDIKACKFYIGPGGVHVYKKSGTYLDTLVNYKGCDSIVTTNLSILETSSSFKVTACDVYLSPDKKTEWRNSGTYNTVITNHAGCDSLMEIELTIIKSSSSNLKLSACDFYKTQSGSRIIKVSGKYSDTIMNAAGCDSIIALDLTINKVDASVSKLGNTLTAVQSIATYRWLNCNAGMSPISGATNQSFTPTVNGSYAAEVSVLDCKDTSACFEISGLAGIGEFGNISIQIIPNPNHGDFRIVLPESTESVQINITDCLGRQVWHQGETHSQEFKVSNALKPGMYFVNVQSRGVVSQTPMLVAD